MKYILALAAGASIALSTTAGAAGLFFPGAVHRSGIERVQAAPGTGGLHSKERRSSKAQPGPQQRPNRQRPDDDGERSNNAPPNVPDPPGCVFHKGPLDLIV
jgi:hypothetical protein